MPCWIRRCALVKNNTSSADGVSVPFTVLTFRQLKLGLMLKSCARGPAQENEMSYFKMKRHRFCYRRPLDAAVKRHDNANPAPNSRGLEYRGCILRMIDIESFD